MQARVQRTIHHFAWPSSRMSSGASSAEIGRELDVSVATIKTHGNRTSYRAV